MYYKCTKAMEYVQVMKSVHPEFELWSEQRYWTSQFISLISFWRVSTYSWFDLLHSFHIVSSVSRSLMHHCWVVEWRWEGEDGAGEGSVQMAWAGLEDGFWSFWSFWSVVTSAIFFNFFLLEYELLAEQCCEIPINREACTDNILDAEHFLPFSILLNWCI